MTPICINLHFLPIKARIMFKVCLLVYKAVNYGQPSYLAELLQHRNSNRVLRNTSNDELVEPIIAQTLYSNRCFSYTAPRMYNALPLNVRQAPSVETFKSLLKTFIFTIAYDMDNQTITNNFNV